GVTERLLGESLVVDDPESALAHLERARTILGPIDAQNDVAKTFVAEAELRARAGDRATTKELLERALPMFEALATRDGPDRARRMLEALTSPSRPSDV